MEYNREHLLAFAEAISPCVKGDPTETAEILIQKYKSLENVFSVDIEELADGFGRSLAAHIKLLAYNTSRRGTDRISFGRKLSETEIAEYFKALYVGASVEQVHLMLLDKSGRVIDVRRVGEGTVNSSEILPRRMVEVALSVGAAGVYLAHNHPFGNCRPSEQDVSLTAKMMGIFSSVGIELLGHVIVAGRRANIIDYTLL